jgi:hypothetical protein
MLQSVYKLVVQGNQKAIVGFVLMVVAGLGFQVNGVNLLDATVGQVLSALVAGLITAAGVWLKANK